MKLMRRDCLLVTDGDNQIELIRDLRKSRHLAKIYAVFHLHPQKLEECLADVPPQILDGAICVARCQIPFVQSLAPIGKTWFVPYGVDIDYFSPRPPRSSWPSALCVGDYCRDLNTLRKSADLIVKAVPTASVRLVAPRAHLLPGLDLEQVELLVI